MFKKVDSQVNLPKVEEEVLKYWEENKIFEQTLEKTKDMPLYSFFDGPPFATGTPHYGHIVASTMKDLVPRYWTMKGRYVPRKWGWDCHGLPIENIAEKSLGIAKKKEIEEMGVAKFNEVCRSKVLEYVGEWEKVVKRLGRWADMKNAYRTMDISYMESVWWVFKQLYEKGLIYEGYRSMHICPRCETTLSQSEVTEGYKMVKDLSCTAKFELFIEPNNPPEDIDISPITQGDYDVFVLAWTTTPWTLPGNVALAVGRDITYVKAKVKKDDGFEYLILAKELVEKVLSNHEYSIEMEFPGSDLVGFHYRPLFNYYSNMNLSGHENGWKVYAADFVTTEDGTGVVHIAPAFGEDDMNLGKEYNLPFVQHVGMDGLFKPETGEFAGLNVKDPEDYQKADIEIIKALAASNLLFSKEKYEHSYPHCWRCDTPLINYATSSWFVKITDFKDRAIELAKGINWSPKHMKVGRFGKWLEGARDWSISRQRYWASVMPIWRCECGGITVVGSVAELENLSGEKVTDLHKDVVDKIAFPCPDCGKAMRRVPDVLDTWFDSGSMPYAQLHYPFENEETFEQGFPAEFIAEGQDQTRAWFYYLHSLATGVKGNIAFKNVVVNGTVLAEDGKKMSKRLQNYPDPMVMFDKYGADAVRLYLTTSPVMMAENLNFKESEVAELYRGVFRMLWNSYSFFTLYASIDNWTPEKAMKSENLLDRWIISELNILIKDVDVSMEKYELTRAARLFAPFIDNLSNWYIRRSRKRFWKSEDDNDKNGAYSTLHFVLVELSKVMAPFTPFIAEEIYRGLTGKESVHFEQFPDSSEGLIDQKLSENMALARKTIEEGLSKRAEAGIKVRQPLQSLYYDGGLEPELEDIIAEEVNVKEIKSEKGIGVKIDLNISEELKIEGIARDMIRNIQSLRKKSGFNVEDRITINFDTDSELLNKVFDNMSLEISKETLAEKLSAGKAETEGEEIFKVEGVSIWVGISRANRE